MNLITSVFEAVAQFFGFIKADKDLHNTDVMQANAQAEELAKIKAKAVADVNDVNLDNLRKDVAE